MLLHINLRVNDIDRSMRFYTKALELNLVKEVKQRDAGYAMALVTYGKGNVDKHCEIQLTQFYDTTLNPAANAFGNLTMAVYKVERVCLAAKECGGEILRAPGLKGGKMSALVTDPDGYKIELTQFN